MSPLKAQVIIDECVNTISVSVSKPKLGVVRDLNVYLQGPISGVPSIKVGQYKVICMRDFYGVTRCDTEPMQVVKCTTLKECQAVALSDYLQQADLELVESGEK